MNYKKELEIYAKKNEERLSSFLRQDFQANFEDLKHNMLIEGELLDRVYNQLQDLERAELEDYWKRENNDRPN